MDMPPTGWYPDPYGVPGLLRWWDGSGWTEHTHAYEGAVGSPERGAGQRPSVAATSVDMPPVAPTAPVPSVRQTSLDIPPVQLAATQLDLPARFDAPGNSTRVFSRDEYQGYAQAVWQRRRRRRGWAWALLSVGTTAVLAVMAVVLLNYINQPSKQPVALDTTPAVRDTATAPASASPTPSATPAGSLVTDSSAGLSYSLLGSPWQAQCPQGLNQTFAWTAGESAVAGQVTVSGQQANWYGNACSGPLPAQFGYNGVQDLLNTTQNLVNTFENAYYNGVQHTAAQVASTPLHVSGQTAWEIRFLMTYPAGANPGMTWANELGAVVVVDRGTGQAPAVFYVSMPANLGETNVDSLVNSLAIPASMASPSSPATGSPAAGNNP